MVIETRHNEDDAATSYDRKNIDAFLGQLEGCFLWPRKGDGPLIVRNRTGLHPNLRGYAVLPMECLDKIDISGIPINNWSIDLGSSQNTTAEPEPASAPEEGQAGVVSWITPGAELLTRCGLRARIYAVDGEPQYPVHGAVFSGGQWTAYTWTAAGLLTRADLPDANDLMKPVRRQVDEAPRGLSPEVFAFAQLMQHKLNANSHKDSDGKRGWKNCSSVYLLDALVMEMRELYRAVTWPSYGPPEIGLEAADVANIAMMLADIHGALLPPIDEEGS